MISRRFLAGSVAFVIAVAPMISGASRGLSGARPLARIIKLPNVTFRILGEGTCSEMVIKVDVEVPRNITGIQADYFVDEHCRVVPGPPRILSPSDVLSADSPARDLAVTGSVPSVGEAGVQGTCLGGKSDYLHTSQTQQDALSLGIGKLNTVTLRWWDGTRTWMKNCNTFYSAAAAYTYKSWNHPKGPPVLLFHDKQCTQVAKCATASSNWKASFHTDFAWCNYGFGGSGGGSANQEFTLDNLGTSLGNGNVRGSYTQVFPCYTTHHSTRTWHNSSASVDD